MKTLKYLSLCFGLVLSSGAHASENMMCKVENYNTSEVAELHHYGDGSNDIFHATVALKKAGVIVSVRQINKGQKKQKPQYHLSIGEIYDSGFIASLDGVSFSLDENGWAGTFVTRLGAVNCYKQKR